MRVPSSIFQQLAIQKRGTILERGDGELVVPAVQQPSIELGGAYANSGAEAGSGVIEKSHMVALSFGAAGVQGGNTQTDGLTFKAGLWHITGNFIFQFTGTTNINVGALAQLKHGTDTATNIAAVRLIAGSFIAIGFDFWWHVIDDSWIIQLNWGATAAGDNISLTLSAMCDKVL